MKAFSSILFLSLTTLSCVFAANESFRTINHNNKNNDEDRQLRTTPKKKKTHEIKPLGKPKAVKDTKGRTKRRKSVVDLSELALGDSEDDVTIQLMSDEAPQTLSMKRGAKKAGFYESWYGMDEINGHHLTMVKTKTPWGDTVTTGTMFGKNGTVYQIRTLADGNVMAEEVKQGMFDMEMDAVRSDAKGDVGESHGHRNLRRLDSASELDIMVSPETNKS